MPDSYRKPGNPFSPYDSHGVDHPMGWYHTFRQLAGHLSELTPALLSLSIGYNNFSSPELETWPEGEIAQPRFRWMRVPPCLFLTEGDVSTTWTSLLASLEFLSLPVVVGSQRDEWPRVADNIAKILEPTTPSLKHLSLTPCMYGGRFWFQSEDPSIPSAIYLILRQLKFEGLQTLQHRG